MRKTIMFYYIKNIYITLFFLLSQFFLLTQIKMQNFLSSLTLDLRNFLAPVYTTIMMILCLWTRYTIFTFLHNEIGNFQAYFLSLFYTKIGRKFPDNLCLWTKIAIFIGWISCIFWVPYLQKLNRTNQCTHFS